MAFVCDLFFVIFAVAILLIKADWLPFEEMAELVAPYVKFLYIGMVLALVIKYVVYEVRLYGDMQYDRPDDKRQYYILMGGYPVLDLGRLLIALGLLSAMLFGIVGDYIMVNVFVYHLILGGLVVAVMVVNFLCYGFETILQNGIATAVLLILTLVFSRGLFLNGLGLFF